MTDRVLGNINYSLRRYQVDSFLIRETQKISAQDKLVLELGGRLEARRGAYDPKSYDWDIYSSDIIQEEGVNVVADAQKTAFKSSSFDVIICSEVLEHLLDPRLVLEEIHRILKPGGTALLTIPFYYHIHADPYDFGRYTASFWTHHLGAIGFSDYRIEEQGGYFSSLVYLILRGLNKQVTLGPSLKSRLAFLALKIMPWFLHRCPKWDEKADKVGLTGFPNGYGLIVQKALG